MPTDLPAQSIDCRFYVPSRLALDGALIAEKNHAHHGERDDSEGGEAPIEDLVDSWGPRHCSPAFVLWISLIDLVEDFKSRPDNNVNGSVVLIQELYDGSARDH